jgi:cobaltochelatase CobS
MTQTNVAMAGSSEEFDESPITCEICGAAVHHIGKHLADANHQASRAATASPRGVTLDDYKSWYPDAPVTSQAFDRAEARILAEKREEVRQEMAAQAKIIPFARPDTVERKPMYQVFGLPLDASARTAPRRGAAEGDVIKIDVLVGNSAESQEAVAEIDNDYVFRVDELKDALMSLALNDNLYAYGPHGTGKTSFLEQILARTNRPMIRVQHTDTTEESHIIGQMVVREGATHFDYGPLAVAMINGWTYLADEYDVAHPGVLAVYQPVLEGKALYIKEAPPSMRLVKPHANFRFVATGNTNGSGDDTGLYSGTKIGNAANYSRFGTSIRIDYPSKEVEIQMIINRIGVKQDIAAKLREVAERVREQYEAGEISLPISPREVLGAAKKGVATGGKFRHGLDLNFINRLNKTEAEAVRQVAQRVFGG